MVSNVIIEETSDAKDILCATMGTDHAKVNGASVFIHAQDMQITKSDIIPWMVCHKHGLWIQVCHSMLLPSIKERFTTFYASNHGHVYLGNNHACSIEGIGTMHLSNGQDDHTMCLVCSHSRLGFGIIPNGC